MKFYKYLSLAALCSMTLASCSDFIEPENKSTGNSNGDSYLTSDPTAFRPVAYNAFRTFATNIEMHDRATDLYSNWKSADDGDFSKFTINANTSAIQDYYTNAYKAINYANGMIKYNGAESLLGAEGIFLRNYGYYLLTQQFGGVPYILEYIETANNEYPRADLGQMYDDMLAELKGIYDNSQLPAVSAHDGSVSKQAVAALAAKIALAAAWDLDTELVDAVKGTYTVTATQRFKDAADWAEKAINNTPLTMTFEQKWAYNNEANAEEIWSMQYSRAGFPGDVKTGGHQMQNEYMSYYGDCNSIGLKGTPSGGMDNQSMKSIRLFEKGDKRFDATFMTVFYNAPKSGGVAEWGTEGYFAFYNCTPTELAAKPIGLKFYPYYWTEAEVEADLASIKSQTVKYPKDTRGVNTPFAAILDDTNVTIYDFKEDGTWTKRTMDAEAFVKQGGGYNGICVRKYDDPASDQVARNNCYRNIPVFHVSDMYLVAAEAYMLAGQDGDALSKINAVRNRAGLGNLTSYSAYNAQYTIPSDFVETPLDLLLDERARECYAERTRYFDLRRTKQLVRYNIAFARSISNISEMSNDKGEIKWYRPIPAKEFDLNYAMDPEKDQNPGY